MTMTAPTKRPLNVFLHVPKTAGTTVNAALKKSGRGMKHVEKILDRSPRRLGAGLRDWDWVSGHVPFEEFDPKLRAATDRPLRYFTVLRDPRRQLASHYNWWFVVHQRGPHSFYRYGKYFRDLSRRIRKADNTNPDEVISILRDHDALFMNHQSKFILNAAPDWSEPRISARLDAFDGIATNSDVADLVHHMTGAVPRAVPSRNVARYGFDPVIFDHPKVQSFLEEHHATDLTLWATAQHRARHSQSRVS